MIRIAIQSKGRLNEQSVELLQDAGLNVNDQKRKFLDRVGNFPIEILYLRDDDIPEVVSDGSADIGIVGYNEVAETGADVTVVRQLGFGGCRISLAIPKADDYTSPQYFQGKRIATSYPNVLRRFLDEQGVALNATTSEICRKLKFGRASEGDKVIYSERTIQGDMAVVYNENDDDETPLSIELLFNAATANRHAIAAIFNK